MFTLIFAFIKSYDCEKHFLLHSVFSCLIMHFLSNLLHFQFLCNRFMNVKCSFPKHLSLKGFQVNFYCVLHLYCYPKQKEYVQHANAIFSFRPFWKEVLDQVQQHCLLFTIIFNRFEPIILSPQLFLQHS